MWCGKSTRIAMPFMTLTDYNVVTLNSSCGYCQRMLVDRQHSDLNSHGLYDGSCVRN
jgi:hypothetical protein